VVAPPPTAPTVVVTLMGRKRLTDAHSLADYTNGHTTVRWFGRAAVALNV
jgi:hypothetical protein